VTWTWNETTGAAELARRTLAKVAVGDRILAEDIPEETKAADSIAAAAKDDAVVDSETTRRDCLAVDAQEAAAGDRGSDKNRNVAPWRRLERR
jgi:hypothetical protein